jgi:hypothetical protein
MDIRWARKDDAGAIARLHVASWQATYGDELPGAFLESQDVTARAAHWEAEIARGVDVVVAEDGHDIVGFVAGDANARAFHERQGMQADGARQVHPLGPGAELREMRYRMDVEAPVSAGAEGPAGDDNWKLLQPIAKEETASRGAHIGAAALAVALIAIIGFWFVRAIRERAATIAAQRQSGTAPVADARRAAEREVHLLLRPVDHEGNIGADRAARNWRLGLACGRLALVEERAGDTARRDLDFDLARSALREAGVPDPTDGYIRGRVGPAAPGAR